MVPLPMINMIFNYYRNTAIGSCSCIARVGGFIASLLKLLKDYAWKPSPMLIMGIATLIAGVMALSFPETVNINIWI